MSVLEVIFYLSIGSGVASFAKGFLVALRRDYAEFMVKKIYAKALSIGESDAKVMNLRHEDQVIYFNSMYATYWDFDKMMKRWWIWDINKMRNDE